ncbi:hypothetical protein AFA91_25700 [Mycolicibacterium goodii]|uniref:Uncharacterized protein n=1 Tax=Mycolicibacterium goodii TaxID=134601 RepID=A0A0K0XBF1_MYCGD|nr:hypothetical protein AFA91_25700 [Mycolicibacterium goodii]
MPGEHSPDTPETVERAVMLTVTAREPDGKLVSSLTMLIERVVARRGPEGWRVEDVSFFPENKFQTKTPSCPPGQSDKLAPGGPCVPNPPPAKQCPDGTSVPAAGPCPQRRRPKSAPGGRRR